MINKIRMDVIFKLKKCTTKWGEQLYLIGNNSQFGNWDVSKKHYKGIERNLTLMFHDID